MKVLNQKNIKMFLVVLVTKLFALMIGSLSRLLFIEVKMLKVLQKSINKHFNKNLIMSEKEEHLFQQSNNCWICKKRDNDEEKVSDHCHITGIFRCAAHWNSIK